ncbi:hypothetical protein PHMEG_00015185 [Phytophthora megakarya]|uniref:BCAS3 WD40 domain-containing protein n=1 Tax=Phytophthora megakarya TaxID=4795 RepID=A0A225W413_9STRA|nr:hypothetical protein PHMEG_00015185 [Phytophthora megakarya]
MKSSTRPTRRSSARTSRRRGSSDVSTTPSSPPASGASNAPSNVSESSLEVTFCAVQRLRGRSFLLLCTRSDWRLYRLDGFSATRESCAPVQLLLDPEKDAAKISDVRFFRLYEQPTAAASALALGAVLVSERHSSQLSSDDEDEDFVSATAEEEDDGREDISVLALDEQKLLHKLPPSPSLVLDVQTNATTAAVLCETRELLLYDLTTFQLQQTIITASPAMALGPRWLAYPGFAQGVGASQTDRQEQSLSGQDSDSDFDDIPIEALVNGNMAVEARDRSSPSLSAIDVAQNVASGLYFLTEVGRATIAPYLSSSPGKPSNGVHNNHAQSPPGRRNSGRPRKSSLSGSTSRKTSSSDETTVTASKKHPGWVVVQDLVTKRVVANFPCHSTALVNLSMDFSGLLLATNSTKGQNLHVYRLSPPLQSVVKPGGPAVGGHGALHHQLVYKLQRGITHASIQDISFSQDGKWINVTSAHAHGTSHLYALHPEGARISADTHANTVESAAESDGDGFGPGFPLREVSDFYADFRALETRIQTQVLRIRHELKIPTVSAVAPHKAVPVSFKPRTTRSSSTSSSSSMSSTSSSSSPPGPAFHSPPLASSMRSSTIMESALDASQALLSQLATSAIDFGHQHFENDTDVASRRRRLRQRLCCLFAPDGLKMLTCCDSVLKLYGMRVTALSQHKADHVRAASSDPKTKNSKSSLSSFGFEASVTELKSWELLASGRRESLSEESSSLSNSSGDIGTKSELRSFAQRSLPLWAHPKVTFRAIDEDHPAGQILEVKRKGPNPSQDLSASTMAMAPEGFANGDEQLFVMEMDSYFGIGGSPVFDGHGDRPTTPEVPPLDLAASINMAMSSSLSETPPKPIPDVKNTICFRPVDQRVDQNSPHVNGTNGTGSTQKGKKKKGKNRRVLTPVSTSKAEVEDIQEGSSTGGLASLQFTMQDMYFGVPPEETSG